MYHHRIWLVWMKKKSWINSVKMDTHWDVPTILWLLRQRYSKWATDATLRQVEVPNSEHDIPFVVLALVFYTECSQIIWTFFFLLLLTYVVQAIECCFVFQIDRGKQKVECSLCIRENQGSISGVGHTHCSFPWFFFCPATLNKVTVDSFQNPSPCCRRP